MATDLLIPFRGFNFYHPDQFGSASIKQVLRALTGKDYKNLEIQEGDKASQESVRVTFTDVSEMEHKRVSICTWQSEHHNTDGLPSSHKQNHGSAVILSCSCSGRGQRQIT